MNKSQIPFSRLAEQYLITCTTEGKTPATLRGYREKLGRFIRWCNGACLADFSVELAREYIAYLQSAPEYENHPFHQSNGAHMSAANVRNHVRVPPSQWRHSPVLFLRSPLPYHQAQATSTSGFPRCTYEAILQQA